MKKLFAIASVAFLALGCSGEDDGTIVGASVEGTWDLTSFELNQAFDLNGDGTPSSNIFNETNCFQDTYIVFDDGNDATVYFDDIVVNMDVVEGVEVYSADCTASTSYTGTYTVIGNNVTVTGEGQTIYLSRDGDTMTLIVPEMIEIPTEDGGIETVITVGATLVFTRQ